MYILVDCVIFDMYNQPVAVKQKYDWGADVRGCEAADYLCKASACKGQKLLWLSLIMSIPCQNDTLLAIYYPG